MAAIVGLIETLSDRCPFPDEPKVEHGVNVWLKPALVCEVKFLQFTEDLKLRAPVFLRVRSDRKPTDCRLPPVAQRK